jgi:hypothetical protein
MHVVVLPLLLLAARADAADDLSWSAGEMTYLFEKGRMTRTLDIDNDSLLLNRTDKFYSSGLRYTQNYSLPAQGGWRSAGWRFGQQLYTPSSILLEPGQISQFDRPYAGWLYGGLFTRSEQADGSEVSLGIDMGCIGPCAGGHPTQSFFHHLLNQNAPRGWRSQVRNEFGLVVHGGGRAPYWNLSRNADLRTGLAFRLGNIFTDLSLETVLRGGQLRLPSSGTGTYGFLRAAARAVGYDATIQGGLLSDGDVRTAKPRRWTGEVEFGLQWQHQQMGVRFSIVHRTNEIEGLTESVGRQNFFRISFTWIP